MNEKPPFFYSNTFKYNLVICLLLFGCWMISEFQSVIWHVWPCWKRAHKHIHTRIWIATVKLCRNQDLTLLSIQFDEYTKLCVCLCLRLCNNKGSHRSNFCAPFKGKIMSIIECDVLSKLQIEEYPESKNNDMFELSLTPFILTHSMTCCL